MASKPIQRWSPKNLPHSKTLGFSFNTCWLAIFLEYINLTLVDVFIWDGSHLSMIAVFEWCVGHYFALPSGLTKVFTISTVVILSLFGIYCIFGIWRILAFSDVLYVYKNVHLHIERVLQKGRFDLEAWNTKGTLNKPQPVSKIPLVTCHFLLV